MDRECYVHPENSNQCIKITVSGDNKQSTDEIKIYDRLSKRNISWQHMAKFYGEVQTDRGRGLVFDLIRDHNGKISRSLSYYLSNADRPVNSRVIDSALNDLKHYLLSEKIIVRDLSGDNILYKRVDENNGKLIVIDGVGNNDCIPIADHFSWWAIKKIKRKWQRFENKNTKKKLSTVV